MGFWSKLGKGLGVAGGVLAAPFTGGLSLGAIPAVLSASGDALSDLGSVSTGGAESLRNERLTEDEIALLRDRLGFDRSQLLENATMDRAKFGIDAAGKRGSQAAWGDALQNVQDVNIDFKPTTGTLPDFGYTGGIRPSMFGDTARQAGGELGRQALMALMNKSDVPAMPEVADLSTPQNPSGLENTLGGFGLTGSILGGLGSALKRRKPVAQIEPYSNTYAGNYQ